MIKVLHMISTMNIGGAETLVKDYAILMNKNQFDIKVVSLDKSYHSVNEHFLEEAGITVIHLSEMHYPADKQLNIIQKTIRTIARYADLYKIVKKEKPNILHVHLYIGKYLKWIPLKKWGVKVFYTVHNVPEHYYDATGKNKKKYRAYKEIKRLLKKEDLQLIALHDEMNRELRELFSTNQVVTVHNGIDLGRFHRELYNREEIREKIGISEDTFIVGHVGRFHDQKNHELIIRVYSEVAKERHSHLLLIGEGILLEQIKEEIRAFNISDEVTILQNRDDIPELMCAMDVFLFPSKWEGFGNVLIEAQSMGLPCVVSDVIPKDAIVNENVSVQSLNATVDEWKNAVMNIEKARVSVGIQKYEIRSSVLCLQELYKSKVDKCNLQ